MIDYNLMDGIQDQLNDLEDSITIINDRLVQCNINTDIDTSDWPVFHSLDKLPTDINELRRPVGGTLTELPYKTFKVFRTLNPDYMPEYETTDLFVCYMDKMGRYCEKTLTKSDNTISDVAKGSILILTGPDLSHTWAPPPAPKYVVNYSLMTDTTDALLAKGSATAPSVQSVEKHIDIKGGIAVRIGNNNTRCDIQVAGSI